MEVLQWGLKAKFGRGSPDAEPVCRHRLEILTAETIKIWRKCSICCGLLTHPNPHCIRVW